MRKTHRFVALQEVFKSFAKASQESTRAQPYFSDQEKESIEGIENLTAVYGYLCYASLG